MTPIEPESLPVDFPIGSSDDEIEEVADDAETPAVINVKHMNSQINTVTDTISAADDESSDEDGEDDGRDGDKSTGNHKKSGRITGWFRRHIGGGGKEKDEHENAEQEVLESSDYCSTDYEMESSGDLK